MDWEINAADGLHHLKTKLMNDFIFIAVMALIFVAGELYAWWLQKL